MIVALDFIDLWNRSAHPGEVATAFGISRDYARHKAVRLRKQGFLLKHFPMTFAAMDKDSLRCMSSRNGKKVAQAWTVERASEISKGKRKHIFTLEERRRGRAMQGLMMVVERMVASDKR